jgi:hypothetical protein
VRNEEVLPRFKEDRNILLTVKTRKAKWIGQILHRNCLLKHVTKGKDRGRLCARKTRKKTYAATG